MSEQSIDSVLSGEAAVEQAVVESSVPDETTDTVEAEAVASTEEADKEESQDQGMVPLPALQEERKKRQELAHRLEPMEKYLQGMQVGRDQAPEADAKPEDPYGSDDKIYEDIPGAMRGLEQRMEERFATAMRMERYNVSEATARGIYSDYDDVLRDYEDLAKSNPHIAAEVDAHNAPAMRAYELGKKHRDTKNTKVMTDDDIQKEVQRRVEEELAKAKGAIAAKGVPQSIAGARGTGAVAPQQFTGSAPLEDIFKR